MSSLAIIGSGFTGLWIGLVAAQQGISVVVYEKGKLCEGVSRNSLGVIHGGMRYLGTGNLMRFRDSVRARQLWTERLPEAVKPMQFSLSLSGRGTRNSVVAGVGLWLNDILTKREIGRMSGKVTWPVSGVQRGVEESDRNAVWWDGYLQDPGAAAQQLAVMIASFRGSIRENCAVESIETASGEVRAVRVRNSDGVVERRETDFVVDASGPAVGQAFVAGGCADPVADIGWVNAINIEIDQKLCDRGMGFEGNDYFAASRTAGKRQYFAVPIASGTRLGTSYVDCDESNGEQGIAQLIEEFSSVWPDAVIDAACISKVQSGCLPAHPGHDRSPLRRLLGETMVRRVEGVSNALCVVSNKLTTAPVTAQKVVQQCISRSERS